MDPKKNGTVSEKFTEEPMIVFRRPEPIDETDRMGREIAKRMIEAGVVEPK